MKVGKITDLNNYIQEWYNSIVTIKETETLLGKNNPAKHKMPGMSKKIVYTAFTRTSTKRVFNILDNAYKKYNIDKLVDSVTQLNTEERKLLLVLLNKFEYLFDGAPEKWLNAPV